MIKEFIISIYKFIFFPVHFTFILVVDDFGYSTPGTKKKVLPVCQRKSCVCLMIYILGGNSLKEGASYLLLLMDN